MPTPEMGLEAGKTVGYTGLGMVLLKAADMLLKKVENFRSTQVSEMDTTWRTGAAIREELRKDNEGLRVRLDIAEKRIDTLEDELHGVRAENEALRHEVERMETALRPSA